MDNITKKIKSTALDVIERDIEKVYSRLYIPEIKDILETSYDFLSDSVVFHSKSKLALRNFKSLFMDKISDFKFLNVHHSFTGFSIELDIPDVDNFDFSGLEVLELITLGVPSEYVELDEGMRRQIAPNFPKAPLRFRTEGTVVYLYDIKRYNNLLTTLEEKNMEVMMFPFSVKNKGFNVFEEANTYDDDNFNDMLILVHDNITKDLKNELRR